MDNVTHMTAKKTTQHFFMHFERACQELVDDAILPSPKGMSDFAQAIFLADVLRRSQESNLPWDVVLSVAVCDLHSSGMEAERANMLGGARFSSDSHVHGEEDGPTE